MQAEGRTDDAERLRNEAFEAWHESLATEDASIWIEPEEVDERRLTEGQSQGVWRRLANLSDAQRRAWVTRFEPVAASEFGATLEPESLAGVARRHPGTVTAARCALILGDRAYERGRLARAQLYWRRAEAEAAWLGTDHAALGTALARRLALVPAAQEPSASEAWRTATSLRPRGALGLPDLESRLTQHRLPPVNAGSRPGLVFLDDTRIAVQTTSRVHLIRLGASGAIENETAFEPAELLPGRQPELDVRLLGRRPPGWVNAPASHAGDLFLVQGRADDGINALICVRPPSGRSASLRPTADAFVPRLRWAIVGAQRLDAAGGSTTVAELDALEDFELQPGPVVAGDLVLVQAREFATDMRAWLFAFDRITGELAWTRFLGQGSDVVPSMGRVGTGLHSRLAGQPLLALGDFVFAGTHLGVGVLAEVVDGRPAWSLKNRRRQAGERSWDGRRPVAAGPVTVSNVQPTLLWAPIDSDRLYALRALPLREASTGLGEVLVGPPRSLRAAEILVGGAADAVVIQGRAGREETVSEWRRPGTNAIDALYLGPDERFQGRGLVSEQRVLAASDRGLYLFDRTRELYLVDYQALATDRSFSVGGDVHARGDLVLVVSRDGLWAFGAR